MGLGSLEVEDRNPNRFEYTFIREAIPGNRRKKKTKSNMGCVHGQITGNPAEGPLKTIKDLPQSCPTSRDKNTKRI